MELFSFVCFQVLAERYGVGKSTAADIIKKKDVFKNLWTSNATPEKRRFNPDAKFQQLDNMVYDWFSQVRAKNINVAGSFIQEKAAQFARELGITDLKASNGWLSRWKSRHRVKQFKVSGESAGVNIEDVNRFKSRIPEFVEDYALENVFHCDETGLYYRALPDKTLAAKGENNKGTKVSKYRITVMFACSGSGEKLKPLVIGKAENPRCFKNVKKSDLKVKYANNKKPG